MTIAFSALKHITNGVDGWVSPEVSPLLAYDTERTIAAAKELSARAGRPNLFIKIPGTKEGVPAIEEAIFAGVPVNVTLDNDAIRVLHCRSTKQGLRKKRVGVSLKFVCPEHFQVSHKPDECVRCEPGVLHVIDKASPGTVICRPTV